MLLWTGHLQITKRFVNERSNLEQLTVTGIAEEDMRGRCLGQEKSPQMAGGKVISRNTLPGAWGWS